MPFLPSPALAISETCPATLPHGVRSPDATWHRVWKQAASDLPMCARWGLRAVLYNSFADRTDLSAILMNYGSCSGGSTTVGWLPNSFIFIARDFMAGSLSLLMTTLARSMLWRSLAPKLVGMCL